MASRTKKNKSYKAQISEALGISYMHKATIRAYVCIMYVSNHNKVFVFVFE
jgi:hypothetical protein